MKGGRHSLHENAVADLRSPGVSALAERLQAFRRRPPVVQVENFGFSFDEVPAGHYTFLRKSQIGKLRFFHENKEGCKNFNHRVIETDEMFFDILLQFKKRKNFSLLPKKKD